MSPRSDDHRDRIDLELAELDRRARQDQDALVLQRRADRICALIVGSDYPEVDIDVAIADLRRWCRDRLPDRLELFDLVYASRFRRLRDQFRP
jgi:hypothetical protein